MRLGPRQIFAGLLFACAVVPPALYLGAQRDPVATLDVARQSATVLFWVMLGIAVLSSLALLLYPPFLPHVKLFWRRGKSRMVTDQKPYWDALYRLQHLETHADHFVAGRVARQLGMHAQSAEHLSRALELEPTHAPTRFQLGLLLADVGQSSDAAAFLESVVKEDESHGYGDAMAELARCHYRLGQLEPARDLLRRHIELFPGDRSVQLLLARVLHKLDDTDGWNAALDAAAAPRKDGERFTDDDALARARARVIRWRGGKFS